MNEECGWNPNWWLEAKASSLDRKRRSSARTALAKPGDAFLIVTEGTVTEPVFFDLLLEDLKLPTVRIKVIPGDASDPRRVISTAGREAEEHVGKAKKNLLGADQPSKFDHVWAVVDTDVATRRQFWNEVMQLAATLNVKLAHSTPCFEYCLLLHKGYTTRTDLVDGDTAKRAVEKELNCKLTDAKSTRRAIVTIIPQWPAAVHHAGNASTHHRDARTREPANPSTEVGHLVRALNDSAPEHRRKNLH
jgi:hypothetical protein